MSVAVVASGAHWANPTSGGPSAAVHGEPPGPKCKKQKRCCKPGTRCCPSRPFADNSVWYRPFAPDARLSPHSGSYVSRLLATVASHGAWVNTTSWSTPVYTVGPQQPDVPVTLDQTPGASNATLRAALAEVPIPPYAVPAGGNDGIMVVWQPCTDELWELWEARRDLFGSWHVGYAGVTPRVSASRGYYPRGRAIGGTASGLAVLGGLIRIGELRRGRIPHAVSFGLPEPRAGIYAWPAQKTDGTNLDPTAIPEGTRFRLDPRLDLSKLRMPRFTRILARAVQRDGMIAVTRAGPVPLSAEEPTPTGSNPYLGPAGFFGGQTPAELLQQFPWSRLQVIDAALLVDD